VKKRKAAKAKAKKLSEVADAIWAYLRRFEKDPIINAARPDFGGTTPYYNAFAQAGGRFVYVTYITYQGSRHLTRDEAVRYLAWLDAGNVGHHHEAFRSAGRRR
jgi:hypothetical protein